MPSSFKVCSRCSQEKATTEFKKQIGGKNGLSSWCRECHRSYGKERYTSNRKAVLSKQRKRYHSVEGQAVRQKYLKENRLVVLKKLNARDRRTKLEVFSVYGMQCECCKEANFGFLTIDHIDGCTKEQRRKEGLGSQMYHYLKKSSFPPGYRTLCYNCNLGRAKNKNVCPHEQNGTGE